MDLPERVRRELASATRFGDIRVMSVAGSTNRVVLEHAAAGTPEGLVVAADLQTAGRGRLDRRWDAARGSSLLVSVLLRPTALESARWHLVTAAAALAARQACRSSTGVRAELKWPNDLLAGGRKLAGILAEVASGAIVVGMGMNVHSAPEGAAALDDCAGRRVSRTELLAAWLRDLDHRLDDWEAVSRAYRQACSTIGRRVLVDQLDGARLHGIARSIDGQGRLVVLLDEGREAVVAVGDVTHLSVAG